jgi:uncharacterized protein YqgV (UPF0045/DUF77 family)
MQVTVEMSIYPLDQHYLPAVTAFIRSLQASQRQAGAGIEEIVVNQMSTQLRGDLTAVQRALSEAMHCVHQQGVKFSLVVKYLNGDLPLSSAVDLERTDAAAGHGAP